jgi:hypothetical protein
MGDLRLVQRGEKGELTDGESTDETAREHHASVLGGGLERSAEHEPDSSDKDYVQCILPSVPLRSFRVVNKYAGLTSRPPTQFIGGQTGRYTTTESSQEERTTDEPDPVLVGRLVLEVHDAQEIGGGEDPGDDPQVVPEEDRAESVRRMGVG